MKAKITRNILFLLTLVLMFTAVISTNTAFAEEPNDSSENIVLSVIVRGANEDEFRDVSRRIRDEAPPFPNGGLEITRELWKIPNGETTNWLLCIDFDAEKALSRLFSLPQNAFFVDSCVYSGYSTTADTYNNKTLARLWLGTLFKMSLEGVNIHLYVSDEDTDNAYINRVTVFLLEEYSLRAESVKKDGNLFTITDKDGRVGSIIVYHCRTKAYGIDSAADTIISLLAAN